MTRHVAFALAAGLILLSAFPAQAKRKDRQYMSHGTANCQAADAT